MVLSVALLAILKKTYQTFNFSVSRVYDHSVILTNQCCMQNNRERGFYSMRLLLYFWPSVHEVFPNFEVVVFQPLTFTPPHIGSRSLILHFNLALPPHHFPVLFLDHSFPPCSHRLPIRSRSLLKPNFSPTPQILSRCKAPPNWESPSPATHQPPPFVLAPRAACLRLLPLLFHCAPPFAALGLHPVPCQPLGGLPLMGPSASLCPCLALPEISSKYWHPPVLGIVVGSIFT